MQRPQSPAQGLPGQPRGHHRHRGGCQGDERGEGGEAGADSGRRSWPQL